MCLSFIHDCSFADTSDRRLENATAEDEHGDEAEDIGVDGIPAEDIAIAMDLAQARYELPLRDQMLIFKGKLSAAISSTANGNCADSRPDDSARFSSRYSTIEPFVPSIAPSFDEFDIDPYDCDNPDNEPRPDHVVYHPTFANLQAQINRAVGLLRDTIVSSTYQSPATQALLEEIHKRAKIDVPDKTLFAICGDMGLGKILLMRLK